MRRSCRNLYACFTAVLCASAVGQVPPATTTPLQPIDQAVEDVSPLSASLRQMHVDLRQPTGFQQVYRVPGRDDLYMRIHGGVFAVFPQSVYARRGAAGPMPLIPAGTMFYIGPPTELLRPVGPPSPPHRTEVRERLDLRIDRGAERWVEPVMPHIISTHSGQDGAATARTIANDPSYRARRVGELLNRAAASDLAPRQ